MNKEGADKLSNLFIWVVIGLSIGVVLYSGYRLFNPLHPISYYLRFILVGVFIALIFYFLRRLSPEIKVNIALVLSSLIAAFYLVEIALVVVDRPEGRIEAYRQAGLDFDTRTKIDVLLDLREQGKQAYPVFGGRHYFEANHSGGKGLFPLGLISKKTMVYCNETGKRTVFESDEYGFNNPLGSYQKGIDAVIIGDSYIEGACVGEREDVASALREFGFDVLSLGRTATGPLLQLAMLIEYASIVKPRVVFWMFTEGNDLIDLQISSGHPYSEILGKYIRDSSFRQNLSERQVEIDEALSTWLETTIARSEKKQDEARTFKQVKSSYVTSRINQWVLVRTLKLVELRAILRRFHTREREADITPTTVSIFEAVAKRYIEVVSSWNGEVYFVLVPPTSRQEPYKDTISSLTSVIENLGLPIIDLGEEIFDKHRDRDDLYPLGGGHYTKEGYKLVSGRLAQVLNEIDLGK